MKLACVVVLYHPSEEVEDNIRTYLPQVDCILKWDNTPRNIGIGAALNEGVRFARANGCTHLMTMDQDSFFLPGEMARYRAEVEQWEEVHQEQAAIFSTNYYLRSQHTTLYPEEASVVQVTSAFIRWSCLSGWDCSERIYSFGVLIASFVGGLRGKVFLLYASATFCYSMSLAIKRRNIDCWGAKSFPMNIHLPELITTYAMGLFYIAPILIVLI